MAEYGMLSAARIRRRVVIDSSVQRGIQRIASEYDGVIMGHHAKTFWSNTLWYVAGSASARTELVSGGRSGCTAWQSRLREMADRLLHLWVPQMDRTDRIQVYERLKTGSGGGSIS